MNEGNLPTSDADSRLIADFREVGFIGPIRVFPPEDCADIMDRLRAVPRAQYGSWFKASAVRSRAYYDLAARRPIVDVVERLLGPNIMLWGANLVMRRPGQAHVWHTDIETSPEDVRAVSVWIGLEHTNVRSSLLLAAGSHLFGKSIQQVASEGGIGRDKLSAKDVEQWAREHGGDAAIVQPEMSNGEALFFDGRLWHGSLNANAEGVRNALLLQFATTDSPIRIPDLSVLDWPFRFKESPRPPCIAVRGTYDSTINRFSPAPTIEGASRLSSDAYALGLPLAGNPARGWKPRPIFRGSTISLPDLGSHVSVLSPGHKPHAPHAHPEEELLIMLSGEADLVLGEGLQPALRTHRLRSGAFAYYPAHQTHTIHNACADPCTYVMFKWHGVDNEATQQLPLTIHDPAAEATMSTESQRFKPRVLFAGATTYLEKLQAHKTTLAPGVGYEPHVDRYDVAIVVLDGVVETLGRRIAANSVIFYAAGEPHGMHNPGDVNASYLVFEFHTGAASRKREPTPSRTEPGNVLAWLLRRLGRLKT